MSEIEKYYNGEIHVDFDEEIEELKADIEEYRDSTTWWSNRFNAVERDNRELRKEIEKLKELVIALWHNDNARFLNKEQIDLLNNIVFGNDEEDLGSDKE